LYGFAGDQVEVRGHLELRTTFTDGAASRMENIRYLVVNTPSAYNILLGRPTLNRLRAVAKRCYENSLKTKRGVFMVTTRVPSEEGVATAEIARERRPEPVGEVLEREIGGKTFKLGKSLGQATQD